MSREPIRVPGEDDNIGGYGLSDGACVLLLCGLVCLIAWLL